MKNTINLPSRSYNSSYRHEIDGLRALAIVLVIINHFNKELLPSGYLGVDMFFVISGYVITFSLSSINSDNFGSFIIGFYERRIKRIIPALVLYVMIIGILICLINPSPEHSLRTGLASLIGLSNIHLLRQSTDYFSASTQLNVFTNTWSLGVEEQFYFLFPFLIWFSGFGRHRTFGNRNLFLIISLMSVGSLLAFIYLYMTNQPVAYFLMPTRFWELSAGCILFLILQRKSYFQTTLINISPELVLAGIFGVILLPLSSAIIATVLVIILSMLLIACLRPGSPLYNVFTNSSVIYIGLISYSLYLWHWGVLSISRWTIGIYWWTVPFQVIIMLGISMLSYHLLEQPVRRNKCFERKIYTLISAAFTLTLSMAFVGLLEYKLSKMIYSGNTTSNKLVKNHPLDFKGNNTARKARDCHSSDNKKSDALKESNELTDVFITNCLSGNISDPLVAFSGDSHSLTIFPLSEFIAGQLEYTVFSHSRDGCAFPAQGLTNRNNCFEVQMSTESFILDQISKRKPGSIVVAVSYLNGHFGYNGTHRRQFKKHSGGNIVDVNNNLIDYKASVEHLARKLKSLKAYLLIIAPLPQYPMFSGELCSSQWFRPVVSPGCFAEDSAYLTKQRSHIMKTLDTIQNQNDNVFIYDPFDLFCDKKYCITSKGAKYLFIDSTHLSYDGNKFIANDFIAFLNSIPKELQTE